ncbi:MAG: PucR family transcriptional regulator [Pseudonocardiaceae bacterium]
MRAEDDHLRLPELVPAIVERLPVILTEVGELLAEQHPDYAGFLAGEFEEVLAAAEGFVARLVGLAQGDPSAMAPELESGVEQTLFEEIGRLHCRQHQDVTRLLAAYRSGAVVTWRHVADTALRIGIPAEAFAGLAAAVFTAVDELSSASLRGYVQEQSRAGYTRERLRNELAELLLSDRSDSAAIRAAASRAGWPLPREAAVVMIDPDNEVARVLLARLDDSCLRLGRGQVLLAIVPDPAGPGRRTRLASMLRGAGAVVGTTAGLDRLPATVRLAELAVRLRRAHILPDDPLFVDEHLDAMVVHHDEQLLMALRSRCLAPLAPLTGSTRDRLSETLTSWLMNMGNRKAVADELHVHPQTVRYRLGQLRGLFGTALDKPATRATLLLALAWGPAVTEPGRPESPERSSDESL